MIRLSAMVSWSEPNADVSTIRRMAELRLELSVDGVWARQAPHVAMAVGCCAASRNELSVAQPLVTAGGTMLVADVRLDNRRELTDQLLRPGAPAPGDAELIASGYQRWGLDVPAHLEGDFAFVLWDPAEARVLAARDGIGVRPLFFAQHGGALWLASEVEQLLAIPGLSRTLDDGAVFDFLTWERDHVDASMFRVIRRVRPAHRLVGCAHGITQSRTWDPHDDIGREPSADAHAAFRQALERAVEARLDAREPVVIHLSGGLDSSSVACLANRLFHEGRGGTAGGITASAIYAGMPCDESRYIDAVVARLHALSSERWDGCSQDFRDLDAPSPAWPGERVLGAGRSSGDLDIIRRHGARVLLAGEGGDEVCSDAASLHDLARAGEWQAVVRETLLAGGRPLPWRLRRLWQLARELSPRPSWWPHLSHDAPPRPEWLAPRLEELWRERQQARRATADRPRRSTAEEIADLLASGVAGSTLEAEQRYSSWAGAETRFPFLARQVIRVTLSLTPLQRRPHGRYRGFQRAAMAPLLPPEVLTRGPTTFESALIRSGRGVLPRLEALLATGDWHSEPFVSRQGLRRTLHRLRAQSGHRSGWQDWNTVLRVASLEAWLGRQPLTPGGESP